MMVDFILHKLHALFFLKPGITSYRLCQPVYFGRDDLVLDIRVHNNGFFVGKYNVEIANHFCTKWVLRAPLHVV